MENALQLLHLHLGEHGALDDLLPVLWLWTMGNGLDGLFVLPLLSWFSATIAAGLVASDIQEAWGTWATATVFFGFFFSSYLSSSC